MSRLNLGLLVCVGLSFVLFLGIQDRITSNKNINSTDSIEYPKVKQETGEIKFDDLKEQYSGQVDSTSNKSDKKQK